MEQSTQKGRAKYCVGCPDLVENIDILSTLRGPQNLLIDMMESPDWIDEKVLKINAVWLDCSMFHLDGHQYIPHLDLLLSIESLDAIEWTPDPQVPGGGSSQWYSMYRKILEAGKSVQSIGSLGVLSSFDKTILRRGVKGYSLHVRIRQHEISDQDGQLVASLTETPNRTNCSAHGPVLDRIGQLSDRC